MKLIYKLTLTISGAVLISMALWGIIFLNVFTAEINDETDDLLEEFARDVVCRWLSGQQLPTEDNGTNNTYYVRPITPELANERPWIEYTDEDIYITSKSEYEPARIRRQIFMDENDNYYEVTVAIPTFERKDLRESVFWSIVLLYLELIGVLVVIVFLVLVFTMRPFNALMKWLDNFVPGKTTDPVPSGSDVIEFRKLAEAAQSAADRFVRQYRIQNRFIGDASHELQTPLAVCSARIEMLLDSPDLSEEMAAELVKMHRSIQNLIRLNKTLLMLSRIDNGQFLQTEEVDISALIKENVASFNEIYSSKNIRAEIICGEGRATAAEGSPQASSVPVFKFRMNPQLSSVLVGNLLKNAFIHSPEGSDIKVICSKNGFSVSNPGVKSLDMERVFTGFYQENPSKEGSTGLGLSLVKSVCENSSLIVSYEFRQSAPGAGRHVFTVTPGPTAAFGFGKIPDATPEK